MFPEADNAGHPSPAQVYCRDPMHSDDRSFPGVYFVFPVMYRSQHLAQQAEDSRFRIPLLNLQFPERLLQQCP